MQVKTITGSSIQAALAEARRLLGDDVVLLESIPPEGDQPARITVMAEAPARATMEQEEVQPALAGYGYGATRRMPVREESTRSSESFSTGGAGARGSRSGLPELRGHAASGTGRGRLFPSEGAAASPESGPVASPSTRLEKLLEAQLKLLHERLDAMERRFEASVIGASYRWSAHPLFHALLEQGMRPATVIRLFDALAADGYEPETDDAKLRWAMAQHVRRALHVPAPRIGAGTHVLIGPSGSGKTSLALKLAAHPGFFGRHKTSVIVIVPEDYESVPYQNPIELYRRYGIPVQSVQSTEEMEQALGRLKEFDHVIIDTPPIAADEARARRVLRRIDGMIQGLLPVEVHFVVNATRVLERFDAKLIRRLPLQPHTVALTHLDETSGWGRVAEWLMKLKLPVRFVSTGPEAPDGLTAFSSSWFVEQVMQL